MLDLTDPLWKKLNDAHRDRDIPRLLGELAEKWDEEEANSLFWDCLCHQETCYGATYAAVQHLLKIAEPENNKQQRLEIAHFLGFVALCAFRHRRSEDENLRGLPRSLSGWDQKLDLYRRFVARMVGPESYTGTHERTVLLPRYRHFIELGPMDEGDLLKIQEIEKDFLEALPKIRGLCQRAFEEHLQDEHDPMYLLGGVAAADGLLDLAHLLNSGTEGIFRCTNCNWHYEYQLFDKTIAIYADEHLPGIAFAPTPDADRGLQDYKDGKPSRADGFMIPIKGRDELQDQRAKSVLDLADFTSQPVLSLLVRSFLGGFACPKCGQEGPIARP